MANLISPQKVENPGALAGATGADKKASELQSKSYPDPDDDASPPRLLQGNWNSARWRWLEAMLRERDLPAAAKNLATVIVTQAADHATGDCLWHNEGFAEALAVSVDTVKRAFRSLANAGWLIRSDGRGRGKRAVMVFMMPGNIAQAAPGKRGNHAAAAPVKQGNTAPISRPENGATLRVAHPKTVQPCSEKGAELHFPPHTPL
ncbi:helix-turn-helix domain-containing protein [Haematobacter genomosp. 1]|uniref:Helix-turn-helix domain-containing protein n=1 Tax=Haematobacter genomosp. 1 TaxID=366618 RepID=A0A212ACG9_9RHOB|nr:helix-turn-helix domain-containing protein [Haematobacter genomosp. 1]OWJ78557.1 hypothetical protein CDV49_09045 [Haematobacter genomosp. 1]